jgi:nucleoside-diphosphate-sugar epimerase
MPKKTILLTGASGRIGSSFFRSTAERYAFRLVDRVVPVFDEETNAGYEALVLDLADLNACQQACQGIDTVIHLAADPRFTADFYESLLHNNILATYNIFRAAKDQGCQRVIVASSVQTILGYPYDVQAGVDAPRRPVNMYGVSKGFAEDVAACFAAAEGLSSIAVRIGAYEALLNDPDWLSSDPSALRLSEYVSARDLNQLLVGCVETPNISFAIAQGISNNRFKRLDLSNTRELFGYAPQDDAFELFHADGRR